MIEEKVTEVEDSKFVDDDLGYIKVTKKTNVRPPDAFDEDE